MSFSDYNFSGIETKSTYIGYLFGKRCYVRLTRKVSVFTLVQEVDNFQ